MSQLLAKVTVEGMLELTTSRKFPRPEPPGSSPPPSMVAQTTTPPFHAVLLLRLIIALQIPALALLDAPAFISSQLRSPVFYAAATVIFLLHFALHRAAVLPRIVIAQGVELALGAFSNSEYRALW